MTPESKDFMRNIFSNAFGGRSFGRRGGIGALALPVLGYLAWKNRDKIRGFIQNRFPSQGVADDDAGYGTTPTTGTDINA